MDKKSQAKKKVSYSVCHKKRTHLKITLTILFKFGQLHMGEDSWFY